MPSIRDKGMQQQVATKGYVAGVGGWGGATKRGFNTANIEDFTGDTRSLD